MTQSNDALLVLMKSIEQEIAIRTEQHVGYQPLPEQPPIEHIDFESLPSMYVPFNRIDKQKREVYGQATAEISDSYGLIFGYCPEAWLEWDGIIGGEYNPKRPVGRYTSLIRDGIQSVIYIGARISRGIPDIWAKVDNGCITGFSVSVIPDVEFGNDPRKWQRKLYMGKLYPYLPRYSICGLSLATEPLIRHVPFDSLPISEHTGLPYDPELISYLGPNHARSKRQFRLFRRREKPRPKQEHVSLFEVLPDGPYARCICGETIEREETHICLDRRLSNATLVDAGGNPIRVGDIVDKWLISRDSR